MRNILKTVWRLSVACWLIGSNVTYAVDTATDFQAPPAHSDEAVLIEHPNEKIDLFTGHLKLQHVDIDIPGNGGLPLRVERTYVQNSVAQMTFAGTNWTIHFGRITPSVFFLNPANNSPCNLAPASSLNPVTMSFELPNGDVEKFVPTAGSGTTVPAVAGWMSAGLWRLQCVSNTQDLGYIVVSPAGTVYRLTQRSVEETRNLYQVTSISDRHGNSISIAYTTNAHGTAFPNTVTTSDGRSLSFTYVAGQTFDHLLNTITSNDGQQWTYQYQQVALGGLHYSQYQLTRVIRPDGSAWGYSYFGIATTNSLLDTAHAQQRLLASVTYPTGGSIGYAYAYFPITLPGSTYWFPMLQRKATSDGGSWSFSYAMASPGSGGADTTTVTTPTRRIVATHFGWGAATATTCWRVGLPIAQSIYPLGSSTPIQTTSNSWAGILLSTAKVQWVAYSNTACTNQSKPILSQITKVRDGTTYKSTYSSFDGFGNPQSITETGNDASSQTRSSSITYSNNTTKWVIGQVKDETTVGIGTISRTYDPATADLLSVSRYGAAPTTFTYDSAGNLSTATNPRGGITTYSNYFRGKPQAETHPLDTVSSHDIPVSRIVNPSGTVQSETNGEGETTSYQYDKLNRVTSIVPMLGNPTSISYPGPPFRSKVSTRGPLRETITFDGFGRTLSTAKASLTSSDSIVTTNSYDVTGRKIFTSYPNSAGGESYSYDALDRIVKFTHGDTPATSATLQYLANNTVQSTDENANVTTYAYRSYANPDERYLVKLTPPTATNATTVMDYNLIGQITSVSQGTTADLGGVTTRTYHYNANMFLDGMVEPEITSVVPGTTFTTTFGRDAMGNMTSRTVGTAGTTTYAYDYQNRLTKVGFPNAASNITQTWTKTGLLKSAVRNDGTANRSWTYDDNSRMYSETLGVGGEVVTFKYYYDANDALTSIAYHKGTALKYLTDWAGRPTQASPPVSSVSFWPGGQVESMTYANGSITDRTLDARQRTQGLIATGGGVTYSALTYGYDGASNVTSQSDSQNTNVARALKYDGLNRLSAVVVGGTTSPLTYDGKGNIRTQVYGGALTYSYDAANRLTKVAGAKNYPSFTYDAYGNVKSNGLETFVYDDAGNLTSATVGSNVLTYGYDALGLRVSRTEAGVTTYEFRSKAGQLLLDWTPSTNVRHEHFYLAGQRVAEKTSSWQATATAMALAASATSTSPTISVSASASKVAPGSSITLKATLSSAGLSSLTGRVTFRDRGVVIGSAEVINGEATLTTGALSFGFHSFTASFTDGLSDSLVDGLAPIRVEVGHATAVIDVINDYLLGE